MCFFCKDTAVFSAEGPAPRRRAVELQTEMASPRCHLPHQRTADPSQPQPDATWGSSGTTGKPGEPQYCWFLWKELSFFEFCINHLSKIGGFWGMGHFIHPHAERITQNRETFPLTFPFAPIARAMGVQREEKYYFRNIGMLPQNRWGCLYSTILRDRRQWVLFYFILWLNLVCPTWCKINVNWVLVWNTLCSKHRKNQTHKCWKRKWHLIKS